MNTKTKKNSKPKKPKLIIDASELVAKLEVYQKEGKELMKQEIINEIDYSNWYDKVLITLKSRLKK